MRYILSLLLLLSTHVANADEYLPVLAEDKVWHCLYKTLAMAGAGQESDKFEISVSGDTLVNGRVCKRVVISGSGGYEKHIAAYEEDGKLYAYAYEGGLTGNRDTPILLMDFTLSKGDSKHDEYEEYDVLDVDYVMLGGVSRRRLKINGGSNEGHYTYWIEGIGATEDNWLTAVPRPTNGQRVMLESYYENGTLIFENSEIPDDMKTGIEGVAKDSVFRTTAIYSIDGTYLGTSKSWLPHGIYIVGGKKVVK